MLNVDETDTIQLDGPYLDILSMRQNGLCCSQIVVKLLLSDLGRENPDLVRSMAALCFGSYSGGVCGILTAAACALSLSLETDPDREQQDPLLPLLLSELSDWFSIRAESAYGGIRCSEILNASPDKRGCTLLLISTVEKLRSMLATVGSREQGCNYEHP